MLRVVWAICIAIGIAYSATAIYAELLMMQARHLVWVASVEARTDKDKATPLVVTALAKGLALSERAAWWAPEMHWMRSVPAYLATVNVMMPDDQAIAIMREELRFDRYNSKLLILLAMRLKHAGRIEESIEAANRVKEIWPTSNAANQLEQFVRS